MNRGKKKQFKFLIELHVKCQRARNMLRNLLHSKITKQTHVQHNCQHFYNV